MNPPANNKTLSRLNAWPKAVAVAGLVGALLVLAAAPPPLSATGQPQPNREAHLDSRLSRVAEAFQERGANEAIAVARSEGIEVYGDKVRVVAEALRGRSEQTAAAARSLGASIEASHDELVQLLVPVAALDGLSRSGVITMVRPPLKPVPAVTSQGVALTNADDWQVPGVTGAGVKVAVLDLGFCRQASGATCVQDYTALLGTELPASVTAMSFYSGCGITGCGIVHGTGVAEIVYDMAPGVQMYLVNFNTEVELANALSWLTSQGITVINASWGFFTSGPGDGTGFVNDSVTQSVNAGATWAVAAGNHAQKHWSGPFLDTDADLFHEFSNSPVQDEGNQLGFSLAAGTTVAGELKWDDPWGSSCRDYDLYLKRTDDFGNPVTVASSTNRQYNGGCVPFADPAEAFIATAPVTDTYHLVIQKHFATTNANMHLYSLVQDLEYVVAANSLGQPADNPNVITTAAVYWNNPNTPEFFSSRGPTTDARIKPDIAGPDGVATAVYGGGGFFGTSAASPHIAGAAALVKQRLPCYTPAQVKSFLESNVVDLGPAGKDNDTGSGRLLLAAGAIPLDTDADGLGNACDTDDDNDTWSDLAEGVIGTNPLLRCGTNAWPADMDSDTFVDITDVAAVTGWFGSPVPPAPARQNLAPNTPDSFVDITDVARITGLFGQACVP